ncbi:MAG: hypothetical protein R3F59_07685 [Myxococcota bacterium]
MLGIIATLMLGCSGGETVAPPEPEPEVVEPEPEPEPAPAMEVMTPSALNAAREENVGKEVTVKGFYSNMTKQDSPAQINVPVFEDEALAGESVLCVFDVAKEGDLAAMTEKQKIKVSGTVSEEKFLEKTRIDNCAIVMPDDAAEGGADEGGEPAKAKQKAGKKKAKAH